MTAQAGCKFPGYRQTCKEGSNLEGPPLNAHHEHTGDGQAGIGAPLLEALSCPPWRIGETVGGCMVLTATASHTELETRVPVPQQGMYGVSRKPTA